MLLHAVKKSMEFGDKRGGADLGGGGERGKRRHPGEVRFGICGLEGKGYLKQRHSIAGVWWGEGVYQCGSNREAILTMAKSSWGRS